MTRAPCHATNVMTRAVVRAACLVATIMCLAADSGWADDRSRNDLFDSFFSNILDGLPCYAKTYDDAYLRDNKAHKIRSIEIDLAKFNSDGSPNSADHFEIGLALMTRSSPEWFGQNASCKATDNAFECTLQADGGTFRLTPTEPDGLQFETGETGISLEGTEIVELPGKQGSDRVFPLHAAKDECAAAAAFFNVGSP